MTTTMKALLLSATASLALTACGGGEESDAKKEAKIEVDGASMAMKSDSPLDKPFKLANAEPLDIDTFLASMDGEVTYDSAEFDADIGATVITNFRPVTEEDGADTSIGRIELYGVNQEAMAAMDAGEGFDTMTELFRKIRMFDVKTSFPVDDPMGTGTGDVMTGNMSIGALEIDTIKVMGDGGEMNADGVEFGGMAMKNLSMEVPFSAEGDGINFAAPDFRMAAYKDGVFGGIMAADLEYDLKQSDEMVASQMENMGPEAGAFLNNPVLKNLLFPAQQSGSIGMMRWDGFTITNLIPYLNNDETPPVSETDLIKVGGMEFLDQKMSVNGKEAGVVAKTVLDPIDFHHFMPKKIRMVSEDSRSDLTAYVGDENPEIATVLKNNGLDDVTGESTFEYSFDPRSGAIKVDADGTADGFYGMSLNFAMSDFDYDAIVGSEDENGGQAALMNAAIDGMSLKIDDEKLLDTAFAVAGAVTEQDPAGLRQQAIGLLSFGAMQGAQFSPRVPEYATALTAFLSDGGTLTISMEPDAPVTFGGLAAAGSEGNPAVLLDTLNVTVTQK